MLLDPSEKQLYLPTTFVKLSNGYRGKDKIIGEKGQTVIALLIKETNATELLRIISRGINPLQDDCLITSQACRFIDWMRIEAAESKIGFCSNDKKRVEQVQNIKAVEIKITSIHDIETPRFGNEFI